MYFKSLNYQIGLLGYAWPLPLQTTVRPPTLHPVLTVSQSKLICNLRCFPLQIDEEQMLLAELKKIEARKRERERKTQDLQKLISRADSGIGVTNSQASVANEGPNTPTTSVSNIARRHDRKLHKKKLTSQQRPIRTVEAVVSRK